jgi:hypothetical protein
MPVKIMCAGCPKDEREPAEAAVKAALGQAAGSWTVSLVKIGRQWSVTVDGPDIKHKTLVVPDGGIRQAIQELLPRAAPPDAPAPSPPAPSATSAAPAPRPVVTPTTATRSPVPPPRSAPAPAPPARGPIVHARSPSHPPKSGERKDRYECQFCGGAFIVLYEASASAALETVAVACPHCWKNSHVMVAEEAEKA